MKIWFVSEVFDASGVTTGYYLARIAASLGEAWDVGVVTDPRRGAHQGPRLEHLAASVAQRGVRTIVSSLALALRALRRARPGDLIIAVTNPPALPILIGAVARLRRARFIVIVHDVYPDVLYAARVWKPGGFWARSFDRLNARALGRADRVIVIGRDMQRRLAGKLNGAADRIAYVPHWPNEEVGPASRAAGAGEGPLVVQYSGNMGMTHAVDTLIECAALLEADAARIRFELIGWGMKLPRLRAEIERRGLRNVTVHPPAERAQLGAQLGRCDLALILMLEGSSGTNVPCRLYNIMAAGRPVIVAADADSELATTVREHGIGWVVEPEKPAALAAAIRAAAGTRTDLAAMGERARQLATGSFSFDRAAAAYRQVVMDVACAS